MTISDESLSVRDSTSGSLLADFPKAIISTFHLVFEGVVRLDHVDGKTKIAVVITNRLLVALVKELKDKKFPGIRYFQKYVLSNIVNYSTTHRNVMSSQPKRMCMRPETKLHELRIPKWYTLAATDHGPLTNCNQSVPPRHVCNP